MRKLFKEIAKRKNVREKVFEKNHKKECVWEQECENESVREINEEKGGMEMEMEH
jgi:hypothetical protein